MPSTHNNHLKHEIIENKLVVTLGKPEGPVLDIRTELKKTVKSIYSSYGNRLVLCMSSGIDSEAMAELFRLENVPFRVATFNYGNSLNKHDIEGVEEYCKKWQIPHQYINVDAIEYFRSEKYLQFCKDIRIVNPLTSLHLECLNQIDGVPVLAWEPPHIDWNLDTGAPMLQLINDYFLGYARYFEKFEKPAVPYFFIHRPEVYLAFLKTNTYINFLKGPAPDKAKVPDLGYYKLKVDVYKEIGLSVIGRPAKYTGMEKIEEALRVDFPVERPIMELVHKMEKQYQLPIIRSMTYRIPKL